MQIYNNVRCINVRCVTTNNDEHSNDPKDQLQIGDPVIYKPEGVRTYISGYLWMSYVENGATHNRIVEYKLGCGINAPRSHLEREPGE